MDILSDYLTTFQLNAHVFLHKQFCGVWAVDTSGDKKTTFHMIARGTAWLHLPAVPEPQAMHSGDVVVFPHDAPHTISNSAIPPLADQHRNQLATPEDSGLRTHIICGHFEFAKHRWNPLLNALPDVLLIKSEDTANTALMSDVIRNIIYETEHESIGSDVVVDKLCEVLFIHVVRSHMHRQSTKQGFIAALADPQISRGIAAFHANPGASWRVDRLAQAAMMSRSAFAERFSKLTGMTPMQYVACWRMQLAHEQFSSTQASVDQVSEQLGYQSVATFSKAFKKHFGFGPGKVRRQQKKEGTNP